MNSFTERSKASPSEERPSAIPLAARYTNEGGAAVGGGSEESAVFLMARQAAPGTRSEHTPWASCHAEQ